VEGSEEMKQFIGDSKKTIAFLGKITREGKAEPHATGFFIRIGGIIHLVTAKHVVIDKETQQIDDELVAFFNLREGGVTSLLLKDIRETDKINWIFHAASEVDIAIIPFPVGREKYDVKVIPDDTFLPIESLCELYDVFFLSFQPGTKFETRVAPIIRSGTISRLDEDKTFYVDGAAFPGNSGSPVFLKPSPIRFSETGISIGKDNLGGKFVGIIGEFVPYTEVAVSVQTGLPRVYFQENTGLSRVWSVNYIRQIVESEQFKSQINGLETMLGKQKANATGIEKTQ
jgi:hypothetical protein